MNRNLQTLQRYFGYNKFRLHQEAIIQSVLDGKDVMAIMPTGGGKSMCYQLPALLLPGITIVISPLIALMKDQVDGLLANGIPAACLNSSQAEEEQQRVFRDVHEGKVKLLYIAPERLLAGGQSFFNFLKRSSCSLFAIDEAHCISQWGHDFRPEYLQLTVLKEQFSHVPVIALTASADTITQKDILEKLRLHQPAVFISSFNRENIRYIVQPKKNVADKIRAYLGKHEDACGIIYALSRASTENIAAGLRESGFAAAHYHAGMAAEERNRIQEAFQKDEIKIIVATIAFGMGIDKPNVRFVIHYDLPKNMEGYYQETGRAGRDGLESEAILFYSYGDIVKLRRFISIEGNAEQTAVLSKKLAQMQEFAEQEFCRRQYILNYFGEDFPDECGNCDNCLSEKETKDITIEAQKFLSAVYRTDERFGMAYVIEVLRGNEKKITGAHRSLKTFGVGKELSQEEWQTIGKYLLSKKLVRQTGGKFPVLQLNHSSWEILKSGRKVNMIRKKPEYAEKTIYRKEAYQYNADLYQLLRKARLELAGKENVPAYIIIGDNSLQELATYLPLSFEDLKRISGFGDYKIGKYGGAFLDVIIAFAKQHKLGSKINLLAPKKPKTFKQDVKDFGPTYYASLELLNEGKSLQEIADQRGFSIATVSNHIAGFVSTGKLEPTAVLKKQKLEKILQAIKMTGQHHALKPVKDLLDENFSYEEIRIAMAYYTRKAGS